MLVLILTILAWIAAATLTVISIRKPIYGIYGLAALVPFEFIGSVEWQGMTWRPAHALLIALWVITVIRWLRHKQKASIRIWAHRYKWLLIAAGIWWGIAIISALVGPYTHRSIYVLGFTALVWSVVPLLVLHLSKESLVPFVRVILWTSVGTAILGIVQFYGDSIGLAQTVTGLADRYTRSVFGFPRIQSTFPEPLYYGSYLLLPIGLLSGHLLFSRANALLHNRWIDWGVLCIVGVVQFLTLSRGAVLATGIMGCIGVTIAIIQKRNTWLAYGAMWVVSFSVALFVGIGVSNGVHGITTYLNQLINASEGEAVSQRGLFREYAMEFWHDAPWIGHGLGSFGPLVFERYPQWQPVFEPGYPIVNHVYAELLAELGVLGLVCTLFLIAVSMTTTAGPWRTVRTHPLVVGALVMSVGIAVQYITFSTLYIFPIAFACGVLFVLLKSSTHTDPIHTNHTNTHTPHTRAYRSQHTRTQQNTRVQS